MKYIVGLDIGGTKCAVVLAEVSDGIRLIDRIGIQTVPGFEATRSRLFAAVYDLLERQGLAVQALTAIGVSCGGPLDSRHGVIHSPPNLPGWDDIALAAMLRDEFGVPAFVQNDANACALVEWKLGAGRGCDNMIFLTMGTGFGGGIIAEGRLLRGVCDLAGEVGHIRLAKDGPVGFGKAGSMEGFCSGGGIGRQAQELTWRLIKAGRTPRWVLDGLAIGEVSARTMAEYARAGDADAIGLYEAVGQRLGEALAILIDAFNPERIVIGSIFARAEDLLRPAMERAIAREAIPQAGAACQVLAAQTGETLGDLAAVMAAAYELGIDAVPFGALPPAVVALEDDCFRRRPELAVARDGLEAAFRALRRCFSAGGKLLIAGNGGSAADADHIVGELMKGFRRGRPLDAAARQALDPVGSADAPARQALDPVGSLGSLGDRLQGALPAIALTQHAALSTAFANDVDPTLIFAQQVHGYGRRGDCFLGISTSGCAVNVIQAARVARAHGLAVICLTGMADSPLAGASDVCVKVPGADTAEIQEGMLPIYHCLCAMLELAFFG
jgi:glucokinase